MRLSLANAGAVVALCWSLVGCGAAAHPQYVKGNQPRWSIEIDRDARRLQLARLGQQTIPPKAVAVAVRGRVYGGSYFFLRPLAFQL